MPYDRSISSLVTSMKLSLDRDFTRFLNDPTFPYKVTVCIGEEQRYCSGALLAQQSSVLERKFREDDGVLMFEEFLDVSGSCSSIFKCIEYLHGADLKFDIETLAVVLKFASLYEVEDLFEQAVIWLEEYLDTSKSVRSCIHFIEIAETLSEEDCSKIKSIVSQFIRSNKCLWEKECNDLLQYRISGPAMILFINELPTCVGHFLKDWIALSRDNKEFIIKNCSNMNFAEIFSDIKEFASFIDTLSSGELSNDSLRVLLDLQKSYFIPKVSGGCSESTVRDVTQSSNAGGSVECVASDASRTSSSSRENAVSVSHLDGRCSLEMRKQVKVDMLKSVKTPASVASSDPQISFHADTLWYYLDPKGHSRGPFNSRQMFGWFKKGYFSMDLKVRPSTSSQFTQLSTLFRLYGRIPFEQIDMLDVDVHKK
ncbi:hypothetical protein ACHWQZ_G005198 [Mnemiopsis leidyi]